MRKLLLATVAALVASTGVASYASAQVADDTDGQSFPTPGTVTVRLNGRFRFYAGFANNGSARTSAFTSAASNASTSASTVTTNTTNAGINKLSNYGFADYARLYPGFDGVAANGLKYGASLEIREDNAAPAGGGVYGSVSGQDRAQNTLYFRRQFGYIGTDRLGTVRVGSTDSPNSLYLTGNFENFNDGGLNGDVLAAFVPGNLQIAWPFADVGNVYTTEKIVYLSPQFYGVDFGVSFEPATTSGGDTTGCGSNSQPGQFYAGGQSVASAGCDMLAATSTNDVQRRKNTYEGLVRYRGTFGPVGLATTASYIGSSRVHDDGVAGSTTNPQHYRLEDLSIGDFGLAMTYAGLTVGGNYQVGRYNVPGGGGYGGLLAKGQPNSNAFIVGASYTVGPVIVGFHYLRSFSMGDQATATNRSTLGVRYTGTVTGGQRMEQGVAAGGTYSLAPGVALYLSYDWNERRQNGFNFLTSASNNAAGNKVDASTVALGTSFAW